jgi:hypothetical protein
MIAQNNNHFIFGVEKSSLGYGIYYSFSRATTTLLYCTCYKTFYKDTFVKDGPYEAMRILHSSSLQLSSNLFDRIRYNRRIIVNNVEI